MNFPPETEADLGVLAVVIILFAIAALLIIWQLVDRKDVKEDMDDSDLGGPKAFNQPKEGYYTDEIGRRWEVGEEVEQKDIDEAYTAPLNIPEGASEWTTDYFDKIQTLMSDQKIIPIMHWESVKNQQWYWRITSSTNGEILARGSEGYSSEQKCLQGLRATVQEILRASGVVTQEPVHDMSKRVYDPNA